MSSPTSTTKEDTVNDSPKARSGRRRSSLLTDDEPTNGSQPMSDEERKARVKDFVALLPVREEVARLFTPAEAEQLKKAISEIGNSFFNRGRG
jgi:hypothetical protein